MAMAEWKRQNQWKWTRHLKWQWKWQWQWKWFWWQRLFVAMVFGAADFATGPWTDFVSGVWIQTRWWAGAAALIASNDEDDDCWLFEVIFLLFWTELTIFGRIKPTGAFAFKNVFLLRTAWGLVILMIVIMVIKIVCVAVKVMRMTLI